MYVFGEGGGMYVLADFDGLNVSDGIGFAILDSTLASCRSAATITNSFHFSLKFSGCAECNMFYLTFLFLVWMSLLELCEELRFARCKSVLGIFCARNVLITV